MPRGFDWKTTFCKCGSKSRVISFKVAGSWVVECGGCHNFLGWLPPNLPLDIAENVACNYGARFHGKKLKDIPEDYIQWLHYNAKGMPPLLEIALNRIVNGEDDMGGFEKAR